ncbi:MAG: GatB/YqeY domain-containing protein [Deltaproteobacteria bacterium]|nr:GatB/YqeY domain-containing protein [Deltaproteobacteria bacterium]
MGIKQNIEQDLRLSMKAKDQLRLTALRMALAAIKNREIDARAELGEDALIKLILTLIKQRQESIELYSKGGRADLVQKEEAEIAFLKAYLPTMLSEAEIEAYVSEAIAATGATSAKDMGNVMKALIPKLQGKADNKLVSEIVRRKLA